MRAERGKQKALNTSCRPESEHKAYRRRKTVGIILPKADIKRTSKGVNRGQEADIRTERLMVEGECGSINRKLKESSQNADGEQKA